MLARLLVWAFLAGLGGAVKFVSASLRDGSYMSPRRFILLLGANVLISGFSGLMGALLLSTITQDHNVHLIAAGMFGYLGTQGLDIIALALRKRASLEPLPISAVIPIPKSVDPAATPKQQ